MYEQTLGKDQKFQPQNFQLRTRKNVSTLKQKGHAYVYAKQKREVYKQLTKLVTRR